MSKETKGESTEDGRRAQREQQEERCSPDMAQGRAFYAAAVKTGPDGGAEGSKG